MPCHAIRDPPLSLCVSIVHMDSRYIRPFHDPTQHFVQYRSCGSSLSAIRLRMAILCDNGEGRNGPGQNEGHTHDDRSGFRCCERLGNMARFKRCCVCVVRALVRSSLSPRTWVPSSIYPFLALLSSHRPSHTHTLPSTPLLSVPST